MTNDKILDMLNGELNCIIKSVSCNNGCDFNCDGCEYLYAMGTYGDRKEMIQLLIKMVEKEGEENV